LSTTALMRYAPFYKPSHTYSWPPGKVSPEETEMHVRTINTRQERADKQWEGMLDSLNEPGGNVKKCTKELERLLLMIDDVEGQTDRHNMLLFLMRDTAAEFPVGFEKAIRNIFDPADDPQYEIGDSISESKPVKPCRRSGCTEPARFDSVFCCDGCGIHIFERALLAALQEAEDVHPSELRYVTS